MERTGLSADRRTLYYLEVKDLAEIDQMMVGLEINNSEAEPLLELFYTINKLATDPGTSILAKFP